MSRYALLILPSTNRVYAESAVALTQAELAVFNRSVLDDRLADITTDTIGGLPYVTFSAPDLDTRDAAFLANLSSIYALFQLDSGLLRPVELHPLDRFDDDLITIQKYPGKTNEQFTKLLLNVTLLASAFATQLLDRRFTVLDPLCGRGTTLNQALMYGFDAAGVELDQKHVEAYATFIQRWLKDKRVKHRAEYGPVRRNRQVVARRLHIALAASKEDYKAGRTQQLDVVNADTTRALEFYRPATFDLVVADAPYGVQHGSRTAGTGARARAEAGARAGHRGAGHRAARSPLDLLVEAAPVWASLLRPGGAVGISWNTFVAHRDDVAKILADAGLEPVTSAPYLGFKHRVDQAIQRDMLIARKP